MKVFKFKHWTFQLYYPEVIINRKMFHLKFETGTTLNLRAQAGGFQILGFGIGVGYWVEPTKELTTTIS